MVDKEIDNDDQQLFEDIEKYGLHVLHILGEEDYSPFSYSVGLYNYSVGLYKTYSHPEIIIVGLKQQLAHVIINDIAEDIKKRDEL